MPPALRVGCSGWNYKYWRGPVYPAEIPARLWFDRYAALFDTVEINNTFYRLPEASTFANWRERAPADFLYAIKASRFLTHLKRLREPEEPVTRLFENARELGDRLGPVLYQLPQNFHRDLDRLAAFLASCRARSARSARSLLPIRCSTPSSSAIRPGMSTRPTAC